jgi:hypothetical protein
MACLRDNPFLDSPLIVAFLPRLAAGFGFWHKARAPFIYKFYADKGYALKS